MSNEELNKDKPEVDHISKVKYVGGDDYDGIRELDNRLPPWLKYIFYVSIVFAVAYLTSLWVFENDDLIQAKEYANSVAREEAKLLEASTVVVDESNIKIVSDEASLVDGKSTFDKICFVCHGKFGEGLIGPNFTDEYWIHGGSITDMYKIVISGVIEKGMISYKDQLSGEKIQNVLSYIISLEGSNPPNQKAAEGERYIRAETPVEIPETVPADTAATEDKTEA